MSWNVEHKFYQNQTSDYAGTACDGPPVREVARASESLNAAISMLEMTAGELVARLQPVLSELRPKDEVNSSAGGPVPPPPCKMAGEIEVQAFRVRMATECLGSILGRLEL